MSDSLDRLATLRVPPVPTLVNCLKVRVAWWQIFQTKEAGHGVSLRADSLLGDHRPFHTSSAEIGASRGVDHRQRGGMGYPRADVAHRTVAVRWGAGYSRRSQLRLV